jgi:hypothetical protein
MMSQLKKSINMQLNKIHYLKHYFKIVSLELYHTYFFDKNRTEQKEIFFNQLKSISLEKIGKYLLSKIPFILKFFPKNLLKNKIFLFHIINYNPKAFFYVDDSLKKDETYIFSFFCGRQIDGIYRPEDNSLETSRKCWHVNTQKFIYKVRQRQFLIHYAHADIKKESTFWIHALIKASYEQNDCIFYMLPPEYLHSLNFWVQYFDKNGRHNYYEMALYLSPILQNITRNYHHKKEYLREFFDLDWMRSYAEKEHLENLTHENKIENIKPKKSKKI